MENAILTVEGMSCNHCVKSVEGSVGKLSGVDEVKVNLSEGLVNIEYNAKKIALETIKETIEDQGYDVK